jgi:hypothetical protein
MSWNLLLIVIGLALVVFLVVWFTRKTNSGGGSGGGLIPKIPGLGGI